MKTIGSIWEEITRSKKKGDGVWTHFNAQEKKEMVTDTRRAKT